MNRNIYLMLVAGFFGVCLLLIGGVWWSLSELRAYREEYDMLEQERATSQRMMQSMQDKNLDLSQVTGLNIDNAGLAKDAVDFYSHVRSAIEKNNVVLLSMNSDAARDNLLSLHVQGSYYALAHMFADWRVMPFASRINSIKLKRDSSAPTSKVDAQIVLEAMMEGK